MVETGKVVASNYAVVNSAPCHCRTNGKSVHLGNNALVNVPGISSVSSIGKEALLGLGTTSPALRINSFYPFLWGSHSMRAGPFATHPAPRVSTGHREARLVPRFALRRS